MEVARKQSTADFLKTHMCAYQGVRNVYFSEKFGMLCFLVTSVLRFNLLPHYQHDGFFEIVNASNCKPSKSWIDQGKEFYNNLIKE